MVERLLCKQEAKGSMPFSSILLPIIIILVFGYLIQLFRRDLNAESAIERRSAAQCSYR
jgi:hypothetical protein